MLCCTVSYHVSVNARVGSGGMRAVSYQKQLSLNVILDSLVICNEIMLDFIEKPGRLFLFYNVSVYYLQQSVAAAQNQGEAQHWQENNHPDPASTREAPPLPQLPHT